MLSDAARIARALADQFDIQVQVKEINGLILLTGTVNSLEEREAAGRLASTLAPGWSIENGLDVAEIRPEDLAESVASDVLEPDFPDLSVQPDLKSAVADRQEEHEYERASRAGMSFFPPTDPVVAPAQLGELEVLGGFAATSLDDAEVERSEGDTLPGDEALTDAVRRELRADASTTDLPIRIFVRRGIAHLRGTVPSLEDAENAEAVASSVPGVRAVSEELRIAGL
ncbi:MAG: BON domain-containing protein [Chloroflexi bacterium]|nr:BON domain-containing protein [Chloroflexota bacterium]